MASHIASPTRDKETLGHLNSRRDARVTIDRSPLLKNEEAGDCNSRAKLAVAEPAGRRLAARCPPQSKIDQTRSRDDGHASRYEHPLRDRAASVAQGRSGAAAGRRPLQRRSGTARPGLCRHGAQPSRPRRAAQASTRPRRARCRACSASSPLPTWRRPASAPCRPRWASTATAPARPSRTRRRWPRTGCDMWATRSRMVVADTREQARDAADAVFLDVDPLPAVTDAREAAAPGAPVLHDEAAGQRRARLPFRRRRGRGCRIRRRRARDPAGPAQQPHRRRGHGAALRPGRRGGRPDGAARRAARACSACATPSPR